MTQAIMRALWCRDFAPPASWPLADVPRPVPGPGEVLLRHHAAAIGFVDLLIGSGRYQVRPPLPFAPGSERAGEITALGEGVTGWHVGQRVIGWHFTGAFAEYGVLPAGALTALPDGIAYEDAAGFHVNFGTAYHGLVDRGRARAGETLLVLGAAGAVGAAAVQVGKALGLRVIAAASTEAKRAHALALGADATVDHTQAQWRDALKAAVGPAGLDLVFDTVGGDPAEPAFRSLGWGGRHLVVGFAAGRIPALPFNLALLKGADLVGVDFARFSLHHQPEKARANAEVLFEWLAAGRLSAAPGRVLPLADHAEALALVAERRAVGRIVLRLT
ncbi:MAG: NADPH:quinone oxidoreductase family protein [Zavarzinia sp.]|nr:NADPH:quinone oxidoreductase family protein [Zavarzinia sp.]